MEDYLEAILDIANKQKRVRVTDVSLYLNVRKPSVNSAVKKLKAMKLLKHEKYGDIQLTERGEKLAEKILQKHNVLFNFLSEYLDVPKDIAAVEACKIEHNISAETLKKLSDFIDCIKNMNFQKS